MSSAGNNRSVLLSSSILCYIVAREILYPMYPLTNRVSVFTAVMLGEGNIAEPEQNNAYTASKRTLIHYFVRVPPVAQSQRPSNISLRFSAFKT
jgi:hypothetical protein